jgi:hypothetical protein
VILALLVRLDQLEIKVTKDLLVCKALKAILVILVQLEIKVQLVCVGRRVKQGLMVQLDPPVLEENKDLLVNLDPLVPGENKDLLVPGENKDLLVPEENKDLLVNLVKLVQEETRNY